ncbi:hypothetical protein JTE90_016239 [Oedothorax gibbosus]|uniref:Uncharacterized protein n=1 Tax=Oedothorax gibbosus TaxID=931172 RepID=A0AAV6VQU8_9ARAC|nr:hypothetical protein JTE90_016239 [Oedothorax gibbosus]
MISFNEFDGASSLSDPHHPICSSSSFPPEADPKEKATRPHPILSISLDSATRKSVFCYHVGTNMGLKLFVAMIGLLLHSAAALTSTEPSTKSSTDKLETTKLPTTETTVLPTEKLETTNLSTEKLETTNLSTDKLETTPPPTTTEKLSSTMGKATTRMTSSTTTSTTVTPPPSTSTEWQDMEDDESQKLVDFVVEEIQKLKVEHRELDDCQELNLSSVLSGKKLFGKVTKYSVTLKVQPQFKNTEACLQQNSTVNNMHPEICEADVTEGDHGGTDGGKTLLRSTCLQVEELQD